MSIRVNKKKLLTFFAEILVMLPVSLIVWYQLSPWLTAFNSLALNISLNWQLPDVLAAIVHHDYWIDIETRLNIDTANGTGQLIIPVNALTYGAGLPFFAALMLATPDFDWRKTVILVCGILFLLLLQTFSIHVFVLKALAFDWQQQIAGAASPINQSNGLALLYQFLVLIAPNVAPLLLWATANKSFIQSVGGLSN